MKKFVLSLALMASIGAAKAQLYLNELYVRPGDGNEEYFELYNASLTPVNAGCYSLVTYFNTGAEKGFYVVDIPNIEVAGHGFLVGAPNDPFVSYQSGETQADFAWNADNTRKYVYTNGGFQVQPVEDYNDIFLKSGEKAATPNGGGNGVYAVFLFNGNSVVDIFLGAESKEVVPDYITEMGTLTHTGIGEACGNFTYNFANVNDDAQKIAIDQVNPSAGTDNGYLRSGNGPCPTNDNWYKSSSPDQHTPGMPNPIRNENRGQGVGNTRDSLTIAANCFNTSIQYNITASSDVVASAFPVMVSLYADLNGNGKLDASDTQVGTSYEYAQNAGMKTFPTQPGVNSYLLVADAAGFCFDEVVPVACIEEIPLPVTLKSFNARRMKTSVALNWETATEISNKGFNVQRKISNGQWETVSFVATKAIGGNSSALLQYSFTDVNSAKGITQYRLQQVDTDGKAKYSEIRSVRGDEQSSKTIVYPNPSSDGRVNVVFDDASSAKNVFVTDMNGRVLKQWRNVVNNVQVDNLISGMYTIRVVDVQSGAQTTEKVVVNKR